MKFLLSRSGVLQKNKFLTLVSYLQLSVFCFLLKCNQLKQDKTQLSLRKLTSFRDHGIFILLACRTFCSYLAHSMLFAFQGNVYVVRILILCYSVFVSKTYIRLNTFTYTRSTLRRINVKCIFETRANHRFQKHKDEIEEFFSSS